MVEEVIWLRRAVANFQKVTTYLLLEWTEKDAINFHKRVFSAIDILTEFPLAGSATKLRNNTRRFLIDKHNYLFYRLIRNKLVIINIIDTRARKN